MIRIKCINSDCSSPDRKFDWDESRYVYPGGGLAKPNEPGAKRMVAMCHHCATPNIVWLTKLKKKEELLRLMGER